MTKPKQAEIVRTAAELQRAHDTLVNVVCIKDLQDALLAHDPERETSLKCMKAAADVLCWALGHDHNVNFEENLRGLEEAMRDLGLAMHDAGALFWLEEDGDGPIPS